MALVPVPGRHVSVVVLSVLVAVGLVTYGVVAQMLGVFDAAGFVRKAVAKVMRKRVVAQAK
jgi:UPF0716 family protein affecting phage T7 exclusion